MGEHTRTGFKPTPAIRRPFTREDANIEVRSTPRNTVTHTRGWGDSGRKVQVVEHDCPAMYCGFDRMVRVVNVSAEMRDSVEYWCLNPNCKHFVRDSLSHDCHGNYPQHDTDTPAVEGEP